MFHLFPAKRNIFKRVRGGCAAWEAATRERSVPMRFIFVDSVLSSLTQCCDWQIPFSPDSIRADASRVVSSFTRERNESYDRYQVGCYALARCVTIAQRVLWCFVSVSPVDSRRDGVQCFRIVSSWLSVSISNERRFPVFKFPGLIASAIETRNCSLISVGHICF